MKKELGKEVADDASDKKNRIISSAEQVEDAEQISLRPLQLDDFIGQEKLKENLNVFIQASRSRNEAIDHTVFYGPPGLGKTTLAKIVANEMRVNFKSTSGPVLTKAGDLAAILTNLERNDVLFIDEIHRLNVNVEEVLYSAMEDYSLDIIIGEGPVARTVKIDVQPFTLVGATTRFGMLSSPLRTRFGILCHLNFYEPYELQLIISRAAKSLGIKIDNDASAELSHRSRNTPRIALRLLRRIRDFVSFLSSDKGNITLKDTKEALEKLEIDSLGLDSSDLRYMSFIFENYGKNPVGIDTIASGLSEDKDSIEDTIEPYLIQKGFVVKTPRGRMLTKKALSSINSHLTKASL